MYQGEGWLILSMVSRAATRVPSVSRGGVVDSQHRVWFHTSCQQVYQGEGWLILSSWSRQSFTRPSVSRGGVVDSQRRCEAVSGVVKCIKGRGG